jgi:CheY-like chemotaxis protein
MLFRWLPRAGRRRRPDVPQDPEELARAWGYRVTLAEDGKKAWEILQQETQPELLILDWIMPGVEGAEICHRIRARQKTPYQYVLLVTAKDG